MFSDFPNTADAIHGFLQYYRREFPTTSITVKLHLMEDHMMTFLQKWNRVGFGLLGEQGAESIHKDFNMLKERFTNIPNPIDRIKCTLKEHHLRCAPSLSKAST